MKYIFAILFLLISLNAYAQEYKLAFAYNTCTLVWSYEDKDSLVKHFDIFINSNKVAQVDGKLRRINCNSLKFQQGKHIIDIIAVSKDGRISKKTSHPIHLIKISQ